MITSCAFSAVGDLYAPQERARWQGLLNGVFGVTSLLGPVVGGLIVDYLNWRWIFFIFLPFGFVTLLLLLKLFPKAERQKGEKIDFAGSVVVMMLMFTLIFLFNSVGTRFAWASREVAVMAAVSAALLVLLIWTENRVKSPILPMNLFSRRDFAISCVISFINGISLYSITYYVAFFVQGVQGKTATQSGMVNMPVSFIMMICSAMVGDLVTRTGRYKRYVLTGLAVIVVGMSGFWVMGMGTSLFWIGSAATVTGVGLGICLPIVMLNTQIAVEKRLLGVATSAFKMFRQFGGTIGIAAMSIVMNAGFSSRLTVLQSQSPSILQLREAAETGSLVAQIANPQILMDPPKLAQFFQSLPPALQAPFETMLLELRTAFSSSLKGVFLAEVLFALAALALGFFIREIPLKATND
jgi:MFS family permease